MHDYMKTIISALKQWVTEKFKDNVSDWNQNDESALDYIKNKPFYSVKTATYLLQECKPEYDAELSNQEEIPSFVIRNEFPVLKDGEVYTVNYNGTDYVMLGEDSFGDGIIQLGRNAEPVSVVFVPETEEFGEDAGLYIYALDGATSITISIRQETETVQKMSGKFVEGMGYDESKWRYIVPLDTLYAFNPVDDDSDQFFTTIFVEEEENNVLVAGKTYRVTVDGVSYDCIAENQELVEDDECFETVVLSLCDAADVDWTIYIYKDDPYDIRFLTNRDSDRTLSIEVYEEIIHKIDPKYLPDGIDGGASSWNDLTDKPFYDTTSIEKLVEECEVESIIEDDGANFPAENPFSIELIDGETYLVTWDGVEYERVAYLDDEGMPVIGNMHLLNSYYNNSGEPFFITVYYGEVYVYGSENGIHTVSITKKSGDIKTIDPKYIKDMYYEEQPKVELFYENSEIDFTNANPIYDLGIPMLTVGASYVVTWDGETYNCIARDDGYNEIYIGNQSCSPGWSFPETIESDEPFFIATWDNGNSNMISVESLEIHSISISAISGEAIIHHIDSKYIKDMYYEEGGEIETIIPEQTISGFSVMQDPIYAVQNPFEFVPIEGNTYIVSWDGIEYVCSCVGARNDYTEFVYIGNENYVAMQGGGDIPFVIVYANGYLTFGTESTDESHTIGIKLKEELIIHKIDPKYLPDEIGSLCGNKEMVSIFKDYIANDSKIIGALSIKMGEEYTAIINDTYVITNLVPDVMGYGNGRALGAYKEIENFDNDGGTMGFSMFQLVPGAYGNQSGNNEVVFYVSIRDKDGNYIDFNNYNIELFEYQEIVTKQLSGKYIKDGYYEEPTVLINTNTAYHRDMLSNQGWYTDFVGIKLGNEYTVIYDGITYGPYKPIVFDESDIYFGNLAMCSELTYNHPELEDEDNGLPFCVLGSGSGWIGSADLGIYAVIIDLDWGTDHTFVLIDNSETVVHKINPKYIPEPLSSLFDAKIEQIMDESEFVLDNFSVFDENYNIDIQSGIQYTVVFNGAEYSCVAYELDGSIALGNAYIVGMGKDTGEPFLVGKFDTGIGIYTKDISSVTISISGAVHKIDKKYLPSYSIFDGIILKDSVNGHEYVGEMQNGTFVTYCKCDHIEVTQMPTKIEYWVGDTFDPSGMVITAVGTDGSTRVVEKYSYTQSIEDRIDSIEIQYVECDVVYTVNVPITVFSLIDFDYIENEDGTYTLTGWKGTRNGMTSTTIEVPNSSLIRIELEG